MIKKCKVCGSFAINHHLHGRDGSDDELCDVCFWVKRAKSHDELVQMNQELLAALESVIEWYDMEADHSIEPDFYKRVAACQVSEDMAREAIAKVKGGAE